MTDVKPEWPDDGPPTRYAMGFTLEEWACVKRALHAWHGIEHWLTNSPTLTLSDQERREAEQELVTIDDILSKLGARTRG